MCIRVTGSFFRGRGPFSSEMDLPIPVVQLAGEVDERKAMELAAQDNRKVEMSRRVRQQADQSNAGNANSNASQAAAGSGPATDQKSTGGASNAAAADNKGGQSDAGGANANANGGSGG